MKMNAKKLALVLLALLLALTCLFAACKQEEKPVEEKLSKEDAYEIAAQFKADYEANYLDLYITEVANALHGAEDEAILKISAATNREEAEKIAKEYLDELKKARTIVDEVNDLLAKVGDVSLADEEDLNLALAFNTRLENAVAGASAAQKKVLDNYKANVQPDVKAAVLRLSALKIAKLAANAPGGVNERIAAMLEKVENAVPTTTDGSMAGLGDKQLTFKDLEDLEILQSAVDRFARLHGLVENTQAYKDVLN